MAVNEAVVRSVAEYLHRTRKDRPSPRMARDLLKLIEQVEAEVREEPTPAKLKPARRIRQ